MAKKENPEMAVIGGILLDPANFYHCKENEFDSSFFTDSKARIAWDSLCEIFDAGLIGKVDVLFLSDWLKNKDRGRFVDYDYLEACIDAVVVSANTINYVEIVRLNRLKTNIIDGSKELIRVARGFAGDPEELLGRATGAFLGLEHPRKGQDKGEMLRSILGGIRAAKRGELVGIPSPWPKFDNYTGGPRFGQVCVLASRKGAGKSTIVANWAYALGRKGVPCVDFAFEDGEEVTWKRILANHLSIPDWAMDTGRVNEDDIKTLEERGHEVMDLPVYIEGRRGMSASAIEARVTKLVMTKGVRAVFVDGFKDVRRDYNKSVYEDERISTSLCNMAERLNIAVVVVHHIVKEGSKKEGLKQQEDFTSEDIRGSGRIVDDARMVLVLQLDPYRLHCIRANNAPTGWVELEFNGSLHRFVEKKEDIGELFNGKV